MIPEDHRRFRELLGALLLDDLDAPERAAVQAHVDGCPLCQEEIRDLTPVVEALSEASPERLVEGTAEGPEPPGDLEERTLARISGERRARRARLLRIAATATATAAAAVLLAVGALTLIPRLLAPDVPLEPVSFSTTAPGVDAEANLVEHTWGTETRLEASGLADGRAYTVILQTEGGDLVPSGSFLGTGKEEVECSLNAAVDRERATELEVHAPDGHLVLAADLP